jgi:integrase
MKAIATKRTSRVVCDGDPFYVIEFTNESGSLSYRVSGMKDGKQVRQNFKTEAEAVARKQALEAEVHGIESSIRTHRTRLTDEQLHEAEQAFANLNGRPLSLAVDFFLKSYREPVKPKLLSEALAEFIIDREKKRKRPDTIRNLRNRVGLLIDAHPGKHVHEIVKADLETVVFGKGITARTQINNRLALSAFFNWCQRERYCQANPVREVERPETDDTEPTVLSLADVRRLLGAARDYKEGKLLPYFALAMFTGIRPAELARLSWKQIDLEQRIITITGEQAKMRSRRVVDLSDNAVKWLLPFAVNRPKIVPANFRKDFDALKALAGFGTSAKEWTPDIMRHTAISMHYKAHGHEGKTASWAGNSPDVVHKHYKGLINNGDAEDFWNITPDDQHILKLGKVA